jgi:hypothetical protein
VTIIRQIDNALWVEYTDADGGYFSGMLLKEAELSGVYRFSTVMCSATTTPFVSTDSWRRYRKRAAREARVERFTRRNQPVCSTMFTQLECYIQVPAKFRRECDAEELSSSVQRSTVRMKDAGDWSVQQSNQAIQAIHANEFRRFHRPLVKPASQRAVAASYKEPSNSAQAVSF